MNRHGIRNYLLGPSLLFLGGVSRREDLLRIIRSESRSAGVLGLLAETFQGQDYDGLMRRVFHKMATEERRHAAVLEWFYRKRFGPLPPATEALTVDCKTLNQALSAGVHRLIHEKVAANRRASGPAWKRAMETGLSHLRGRLWQTIAPSSQRQPKKRALSENTPSCQCRPSRVPPPAMTSPMGGRRYPAAQCKRKQSQTILSSDLLLEPDKPEFYSTHLKTRSAPRLHNLATIHWSSLARHLGVLSPTTQETGLKSSESS